MDIYLELSQEDEALIKKYAKKHGVSVSEFIIESVIKRIETDNPQTFKELIEGYEGEYKCEEWDTGNPQGKEII